MDGFGFSEKWRKNRRKKKDFRVGHISISAVVSKKMKKLCIYDRLTLEKLEKDRFRRVFLSIL